MKNPKYYGKEYSREEMVERLLKTIQRIKDAGFTFGKKECVVLLRERNQWKIKRNYGKVFPTNVVHSVNINNLIGINHEQKKKNKV